MQKKQFAYLILLKIKHVFSRPKPDNRKKIGFKTATGATALHTGVIIIILIIVSLFQEDNIFGTNASLTYVLDYKGRTGNDTLTCINYLQ